MGYVSQDDILQAKEMDLLTYLQNYEPNELLQLGPNNYCTRTHDSLKISNGKWCWFSRGIGGKTALDYLIKVQGYSFTRAVETILGKAASQPPVISPVRQPQDHPHKLLMPELNDNTDTVVKYLIERGIHSDVIDYCLNHRLLFESKRYHNAVFVGYDKNGIAKYAALRGTMGSYKGEVTGSDKHYSFSITKSPDVTTVHLFESAIDLLSHASLMHMRGQDWKHDALLSLAGVYKTKHEAVVPVALSQFLTDFSNIKTLRLHLDNDDIGRGATKGIIEGLKGKYEIIDEPPRYGKDVNDSLKYLLNKYKRKETTCR